MHKVHFVIEQQSRVCLAYLVRHTMKNVGMESVLSGLGLAVYNWV
jgi:hypothetical protein